MEEQSYDDYSRFITDLYHECLVLDRGYLDGYVQAFPYTHDLPSHLLTDKFLEAFPNLQSLGGIGGHFSLRMDILHDFHDTHKATLDACGDWMFDVFLPSDHDREVVTGDGRRLAGVVTLYQESKEAAAKFRMLTGI